MESLHNSFGAAYMDPIVACWMRSVDYGALSTGLGSYKWLGAAYDHVKRNRSHPGCTLIPSLRWYSKKPVSRVYDATAPRVHTLHHRKKWLN